MKTVPGIIGKLWALPTTIVFGLPFGLLGACLAPRKIRIRLAHNAICFYNHPLLRGPAIAVTLGNVIAFQKDSDYCNGQNIGEHERQHTIQAEILGIFYVPLHLICLAIYGRNVEKNPLERGPYSDPPRPW